MAGVREQSDHSMFPRSKGAKANRAKSKKFMYLKNRLYIMNQTSLSRADFDLALKTIPSHQGAKCKKSTMKPFFWKLLSKSCNTL